MARVICLQYDTFRDSKRDVTFTPALVTRDGVRCYLGVAEVTDEEALAWYRGHHLFQVIEDKQEPQEDPQGGPQEHRDADAPGVEPSAGGDAAPGAASAAVEGNREGDAAPDVAGDAAGTSKASIVEGPAVPRDLLDAPVSELDERIAGLTAEQLHAALAADPRKTARAVYRGALRALEGGEDQE